MGSGLSARANIIELKTNLRFYPSSKLAKLAELFAGEDEPPLAQLEEILETPANQQPDASLDVRYFSDEESLENAVKDVLTDANVTAFKDETAFEVFAHLFERAELTHGEVDLDRVQIITPRRIGSFGSEAINRKVIMRGNPTFCPQTKLICEENIYTNVEYKRILGLANGSIGHITDKREARFSETDELEEVYGSDNLKLKREVRKDVFSRTR